MGRILRSSKTTIKTNYTAIQKLFLHHNDRQSQKVLQKQQKLISFLYNQNYKINKNHDSFYYYHSLHHKAAKQQQSLFSTSSSSSSSKNKIISNILQQNVKDGKFQYDKAQQQVAKRLSKLSTTLQNYDNKPIIETIRKRQQIIQQHKLKQQQQQQQNSHNNKQVNSIDNINERYDIETSIDSYPELPSIPIKIPRGLYIHGSVGSGKTMLMDTFYEQCQVENKCRFHFHHFLSQVHQRIHTLKQQDLKQHGRDFKIDLSLHKNPIYRVANEICNEYSLVCLDEFQVTDIADALILSQLFTVLFQNGTVLVATSNRPPPDLYEGGLNRSYFEPFIDLLAKHVIVHEIASNVDYRKLNDDGKLSYFVSPDMLSQMKSTLIQQLSQKNKNNYNNNVDDMNVKEGGREEEEEEVLPTCYTLQVGFDRELRLSNVYIFEDVKMVEFDFDELCNVELGALDYRLIGKEFDIIILEDIPLLNLQQHNISRRFITLIDELYDNGDCVLLCSCEHTQDPSELFETPTRRSTWKGKGITKGLYSLNVENVKSNADADADSDVSDDVVMLGIDEAVTNNGGAPLGALASVKELEFAFERASSRLYELCSPMWWNQRIKLK